MENLDRSLGATPCGNLKLIDEPSSSDFSSRGEKTPKRIMGSNVRSTMNERSLGKFEKDNRLKEIFYFVPTPQCRVDDPPIEGTCFYTRIIEDGVGLPIHPFFYDVLDSYGIAPGKMTPHAWCQMAGMLLLWGDLHRRVPSVDVWNHIYRLEVVRHKFGSYYVTRHAKGLDMLIEGLSSSCGDWLKKWFYLDITSCIPRLQRNFKKPVCIEPRSQDIYLW